MVTKKDCGRSEMEKIKNGDKIQYIAYGEIKTSVVRWSDHTYWIDDERFIDGTVNAYETIVLYHGKIIKEIPTENATDKTSDKGITCPLCGEFVSYKLVNNKHTWTCPECPFVGTEVW